MGREKDRKVKERKGARRLLNICTLSLTGRKRRWSNPFFNSVKRGKSKTRIEVDTIRQHFYALSGKATEESRSRLCFVCAPSDPEFRNMFLMSVLT